MSQLPEKELKNDVALSLEHAILTPSGHPSWMNRYANARAIFEDHYLMLYSKDQMPIAKITEEDIKWVKYWKSFTTVDVKLSNGDRWSLNVQQGKDADALLSWFCG